MLGMRLGLIFFWEESALIHSIVSLSWIPTVPRQVSMRWQWRPVSASALCSRFMKCTVTFYLTWRHISPVKEAFAKSGLLFWLNLAKAMLVVKC
jgi:hypothetical protein